MSKNGSDFRVTFLGHQGWLIASGSTALAVDCVLCEPFGHDGSAGTVYPPRRLKIEAFPALAGFLFSHEHDDHFNIPSLNRLDRAIPVYISERSSVAARKILAEMGFQVKLLQPGRSLSIGDLELTSFSPFHQNANNMDEWDVLPFLIRDRAGHGSIFSAVDVQLTEDMVAEARTLIQRPGIWCYANNAADLSCLNLGEARAEPALDSLMLASILAPQHSRLRREWTAPAISLVCGGGFSFTGDREDLNRRVFCADSEAVAEALSRLCPSEKFLAPAPGQTVVMRNGELAAVEPRASFLESAPRDSWPRRGHEFRPLEDYQPACGEKELPENLHGELLAELAQFAGYLYGRSLFERLYSLSHSQLAGRAPTFAVVLRADAEGSSYVLEYEAQSCSFVASRSADPAGEFVAGMECWGTDLLKLFRGELSPPAVCFGRMRFWNAFPGLVKVSMGDLWMYQHPLRRPDRFLHLYRLLLDKEPRSVYRIPAADITLTKAAKGA